MAGIYKITNNINNKSYIGWTSKRIEDRWKEHIKTSKYKNKTKNYRLVHKAFNKYGIKNFTFQKLIEVKECSNEKIIQLLKHSEELFIEYYDTFNNGYNLTKGGDGTKGTPLSEQQKQHLSKLYLGRKLSQEHKTNISKGLLNANRHMSDELKTKLIQLISKSCIVFFLDNGEIIREFDNQHDCGNYYGVDNKIVSEKYTGRRLVFGQKNQRDVGIGKDLLDINNKVNKYNSSNYSRRHNTKTRILQD